MVYGAKRGGNPGTIHELPLLHFYKNFSISLIYPAAGRKVQERR
jgi:hypothetical protein